MKKYLLFCVAFVLLLSLNLKAQSPQIPTLQVCNQSKVYGKALIFIRSRQDRLHRGVFTLIISPRQPITCGPNGYPSGRVIFKGIDLSDSFIRGDVVSTFIEQVTTTGKHTPMAFIRGRCELDPQLRQKIKGCRFWLLITDNRPFRQESSEKLTPDLASFLIIDSSGRRISYGSGPVIKGDLTVAPTPN